MLAQAIYVLIVTLIHHHSVVISNAVTRVAKCLKVFIVFDIHVIVTLYSVIVLNTCQQ